MMEKVDIKNGGVIAKEAAFHSKSEVNLERTNSNESLAKFQRHGSNWSFHSVLSLDLHTVKYEPLGGSSYIPLSAFLAAKKANINLRNEDECFKWAITRALCGDAALFGVKFFGMDQLITKSNITPCDYKTLYLRHFIKSSRKTF